MARLGSQAVYLPRVLVERLVAEGAPPSFPHRDRFAGSVLVVDVSRQLDEISSRLPSVTMAAGDSGRFARVDASAGVERISQVLPPVFDAVRRAGGSVVTFGQGAVVAVFPGPHGAARGRVAAAAIERAEPLAGGEIDQRLHAGA